MKEFMTDRVKTVENVAETAASASYLQGYEDGLRLGVCQAVMERIPATEPYYRDMKVFYIPQGFHAIDQGISAALSSLVRECIVVEAPKMLELAQKERPDLILVLNGLHVFPENHLEDIRRVRAMGIKTAVWFVDDPYFSEDTAAACTAVHYLPLAVNVDMFKPLRCGPEHLYDICFIGNAFWNRVAIFDELAPFLRDKNVLIAGGFWERLSQQDLLGRSVRLGFIPPEETVRYYNGSKVVINIHRPDEWGQDNRNSHRISGKSINPRTYEINACGAMQITDIREDLTNYYRPGYDIETFTSPEELKNKINYYLEHEEERRIMAARGLYTTRQEHTFISRMRTFLEQF
ncbi:hypothetical protein BGX30_003764 [Mortierella sp. GBA39]|nr:hypothetical protein BGX30_003764 [Mortierella sp. GBA39]